MKKRSEKLASNHDKLIYVYVENILNEVKYHTRNCFTVHSTVFTKLPLSDVANGSIGKCCQNKAFILFGRRRMKLLQNINSEA